MKHKWLFMAVICIVIGSFAYSNETHAATDSKKYAVALASLTVREQASTSAKAVKYLKANDKVPILKETNGWLYIEVTGIKGYISSNAKYVKIVTEEIKPVIIEFEEPKPIGVGKPRTGMIKEDTLPKSGNVKENVNLLVFRSGPTIESAKIRYFNPGEKFKIISKPNSEYYEVEDSFGTKGYVSTNPEYVKVSDEDFVPDPNAELPVDKPELEIPLPQGEIDARIESAIVAGSKYFGVPYQYGADRNSITAFDCSSFVRRAFLDATGLNLPWDSRAQAQYVLARNTPLMSITELKRGDFIFFTPNTREKDGEKTFDTLVREISHVGIYLGNGTMLNSNGGGSNGVQITDVTDKYWSTHFLFGGSIYTK